MVAAANVTTYSNTLSDSAPSVVSNHTITFTTPTGVANGETITVDFSDGPFVVGSVDFSDIDVATTSDYSVATDCTGSEEVGAAFGGTTLTLTFCSGDGGSVPANGTTTIEIGTNATFGTTGDQQLTNPVAGSYQIPITAGASDTGETRVAIVDNVTVTASVDTVFTFSVAGVSGGTLVNTSDTTGGPTTPTTIPFGELDANTASTAAQLLSASTNAANGFVVTVQADQQLTSTGNSADIDGFRNGNFDTTPVAWEAPGATVGSEETYGHWGLSSDDTTLTAGLSDLYSGGDDFVSASTTPVEVFRNDGPSNGTGAGQGTTTVIYKVEVSSLQEAANDYTATLTYVATPVF
tara:strand:+ start:11145 stop:12197 length:1053 start_codon:yes stop_codon:yes gene_type:complete